MMVAKIQQHVVIVIIIIIIIIITTIIIIIMKTGTSFNEHFCSIRYHVKHPIELVPQSYKVESILTFKD